MTKMENSLMTKQHLVGLINESIRAVSFLQQPHVLDFLEDVAELLANMFNNDGKVIAIGNGGSLCDAAHFAEELTGFFRYKRPSLPAIAVTEPAHITCVANDIGYEWVFARAISAFGKPGDVLIALSTSGRSPSIIRAVEEAQKCQMRTVTFLGKGGGDLRGVADYELIIEGFSTSDRIQEAHMAALHILIELVERRLFPEVYAPLLAQAIQN